jgi:hypothetical protein
MAVTVLFQGRKKTVRLRPMDPMQRALEVGDPGGTRAVHATVFGRTRCCFLLMRVFGTTASGTRILSRPVSLHACAQKGKRLFLP